MEADAADAGVVVVSFDDDTVTISSVSVLFSVDGASADAAGLSVTTVTTSLEDSLSSLAVSSALPLSTETGLPVQWKIEPFPSL